MIVAITGHRPPKLNLTWDGRGPMDVGLVDLLCHEFDRLGTELVITGMALGVDLLAARAAWKMGLPFDAYVPFPEQPSRWPEASQARWRTALSLANDVRFIRESYQPGAFYQRNEAMVDAADHVVAVWDGSTGGTAHCVNYARRVGRPLTNLIALDV